MNVTVYNQTGEKISQIELSEKVFGIKPKPELIHQVVVAMQANLRRPYAHTKTRGEVRGGGKKPWRQKGTGRARAGSIRSPLWRGGGIIFGPRKERVYKKKINKKVKRLALKMALSDKLTSKRIIVLESLKLKEQKTKLLEEILNTFSLKNKKTYLVLEKKDQKILLSARNIPYLKTTIASNLNLLDLLKNKYLLTTKKAIREIEKIYQ